MFSNAEINEQAQRVLLDMLVPVDERQRRKVAGGTKKPVFICPSCGGGYVLNPDGGRWHCLKCGVNGRAIDLVMQAHGVDKREGFRLMMEGAVVQCQPVKPKEKPNVDDSEWRKKVALYCKRCAAALTAKSAGGAYLIGRGFDLEFVRRYGFGYDAACTGMNGGFGRAAVVMPYDSEKSFFSARFLNKMRDGRRFTRPSRGHYAGSWEPPIFHGKQLWLDAQAVFITESELDAVSISQAAEQSGVIVGAVATGGAGAYNGVIRALSQRPTATRVIIAFDADETGRRDALAFSDKLAAIGQEHEILNDFDGLKDANELLRAGGLGEHIKGVLSDFEAYCLSNTELGEALRG